MKRINSKKQLQRNDALLIYDYIAFENEINAVHDPVFEEYSKKIKRLLANHPDLDDLKKFVHNYLDKVYLVISQFLLSKVDHISDDTTEFEFVIFFANQSALLGNKLKKLILNSTILRSEDSDNLNTFIKSRLVFINNKFNKEISAFVTEKEMPSPTPITRTKNKSKIKQSSPPMQKPDEVTTTNSSFLSRLFSRIIK